MKQRPALELESTILGAVDLGTGQVGGQQIRRELDPMKISCDTLTQDLDGPGLGQARCALNQ